MASSRFHAMRTLPQRSPRLGNMPDRTLRPALQEVPRGSERAGIRALPKSLNTTAQKNNRSVERVDGGHCGQRGAKALPFPNNTFLYNDFSKQCVVSVVKKSGVYAIRNELNGKIYVGSTANFQARWRTHKFRLNRGTHTNPHLQGAWNKYGASAFEFSVLEECEISMVTIREQAWVDYYSATNPTQGYNLRLKVESNRGYKLREETKKRISNANKGKSIPLETREKIRNSKLGKSTYWNRGKPRSDETKQKISLANTGHTVSEITKQKIIQKLKGRRLSTKTEFKHRSVPWNKGIPCSEETKHKISETKKAI